MKILKYESIAHIDQITKYNNFPILIVIYDGNFFPLILI
jgi:hypothetical protein